jgi:AraC family transcriptional regulator of adaptative response / DNA-3-methyladenine glycosylase II
MEMELNHETMLAGMLAQDSTLNGRFLTGVVTTGVYCLPSCSARKPNPENVHFFPGPEAAETAGLRPCKRCRPDLFYQGRDPDRELVETLVDQIRKSPQDFSNAAALPRHAQVSSSKLHELLRLHFHTTASEILNSCRIESVCHRLLDSDRPVADLAFEAGFGSLSTFNDQFRRRCHMGPTDYRNALLTGRGNLLLPSWFRQDQVLAYLGRDPQSAHEQVIGQHFRCAAHLRQPVAMSVEIQGQKASFTVQSDILDPSDIAEVHRRLLRLLGLVINPGPFERRGPKEPLIQRLVGLRKGLTIPQTATFFDGVVWVVAGQQVSLPVAFSLRRRLGERCGTPMGDGLFAPPTAAQVAQLEPEELRRLGFSRRKTEYLLELARAVVDDELELAGMARRSAVELNRRLLARRGLGPWSVQYLMMRAFGFADCVPLGDAALNRNLENFFGLEGRPSRAETLRLMAPFAPHRSLATFHFWSLEKAVQ